MKTEIENGYKVKDGVRIEDYIVDQLEAIKIRQDYLYDLVKELIE